MIGRSVSDEQLIAFAAGELGAVEAAAVARHVGACPRCAARVKRFQLIRDLVRSDDSADPPPAVLARARALLPQDARFHVQKPSAALPRRRLFAFAIAAGVLLLFVFGLSQGVQVAAAAAESSLPGDTLYPLKTTLENVRLAIASDAADQVQLHLELVQTRLWEIQILAAQKRYSDMEAASAGFQAQTDETMKSLNVLAARDPERAARSASLVLQSFARASLVLNTLLADVPVSQRPAIEHAARQSDASASTVRGRMLGATSTPLSPSATPTNTSEPPTATSTHTDTPWPMPSQTPLPSTDTPSATPVPAAPLATPPGQAKTPPGQAKPPGQVNTPPGQVNTPPGRVNTPPGRVNTPPGQVSTPPGKGK